MPVLKIAGNDVVEAGTFTMGLEDVEAEYGVAGVEFLFRVEASGDGVEIDRSDKTVVSIRPHQSTQVSVHRSDWEVGGRRFSAVFTIRGSAPGPDLRSAHLVSYTVTERPI